jgi:ferredoxin
MKIKIDQLKCDTSGMCVKKFPQLFRFQEGSKKAEVIEEKLPLYLEPECKCIVEICPTGAITIE